MAEKELETVTTPNFNDEIKYAVTRVTTKTGAGTLTVSEGGLIKVSAASAYTLTLPTAVGHEGLTYHFVKTDANYNLITLDGNGTETFNFPNDDGVPKQTYTRLNTYCAEVTVVSDGANWQCINEKLGQVPYCNVYLATAQSIPNNLSTWINFGGKITDIGNNFTNAIWVNGSASATTASHLIDTTNNPFTADMVGYQVKNTTDGTYAIIKAYNSTSDVTISSDIFVSGEDYEIRYSKFIVPVSGKYGCNLIVLWDNVIADKRYALSLHKNTVNTAAAYVHSSNNGYLSNSIPGIFPFSKNDIIRAKVYHLAGADTPNLFPGINYSFILRLISKE